MTTLLFTPVNAGSIGIATQIAKTIFPYEVSASGIFLPEYDYMMSIACPDLAKFFIAEFNGSPIGITGFYHNFRKPIQEELWLGYFGVLSSYRGNGLGKKILLETLSRAKQEPGCSVLKLFTTNRPEEKPSHHLYKCVGFELYAHWNTKPFQTYYFRTKL